MTLRRYLAILLFAPFLLLFPAAALSQSTSTITLSVTNLSGSAVTSISSGTAVQLTAAVQSDGTAVNPGTVDFCDATASYCTDIHQIGTAQLTSSGSASIRFVPGPGSHVYKAVFVGTNLYAGSTSSNGSLSVFHSGAYATTTAIAATGSAGNYTLTATVGSTGPSVPTGTVSFQDASKGNALITKASLGQGVGGGYLDIGSMNVNYSILSLAVGDFNGDGILDLVEPTAILLNDGNGNFTIQNQIRGYASTTSIVVADFDNDGLADIVEAAPGASNLLLFLGNGDGTFVGPIDVGSSGGYSIAVGDFDGDGNLDLAAAYNGVTILLGNGTGQFKSLGSITVGASPVSVVIGDFNNDGRSDIASLNEGDETLSVLLGAGDGSFSVQTLQLPSNPRTMVEGDFNGDGNLDIIVTYEPYEDAQNIGVLLGRGNGSFSSQLVGQPGAGSLAIGDFNGDGIPDLAARGEDGEDRATFIYFLIGTGSGSFTASSPTSVPSGFSLVTADLNMDGVLDLIVGSQDQAATYLKMAQVARASAANISLPASSGTHQIDALYSGDANSQQSTSPEVSLSAPTSTPAVALEASAERPTYATNVTLVAMVTGNGLPPTGNVTFADSGVSIGSSELDAEGDATFSTAQLIIGSHTITSTYSGDSNYKNASSNSITVVVGKETQTINFPAIGSQNVGQTVTLQATATSGLAVSYASQTTSVCTVSGSTASTVAAGTCRIQATQSGNSTYAAATPVSQTFAVTQSVAAAPSFSPGGGTYTSVQLVNLSDSMSGASIHYTVDGSTPTAASSTYSGRAISVATSQTLRAIAIASGYANSSISAASYTINLAQITMTLGSSLEPATPGATVTFTVGVAPQSGSTVPTGTVTFRVDGGVRSIVTLDGTGHAKYSTNSLPSGAHTIAAAYSGNSIYPQASANFTEIVGTTAVAPSFSPAPGQYGSTQTVTITDGTSGATIYYTTDGSKPTSSSTRYGGPIKVSATETVQAIAAAGGYNNSAVAGGVYTIGSSSATTISLTASRDPVPLNQGVQFTATVAAASGVTPTGTVSFANGSSVFATSTLSGGVATAATFSLPLGVDSITATYSGDGSHASSSSMALGEHVVVPTSVQLTTSTNPAKVKQAVTFTVTVTATSGGTPTGSVTFLNSATTLATVSLSGGSASLTTSALSAGHHSITATYSGNATDAAGKSPVLVQTVNP